MHISRRVFLGFVIATASAGVASSVADAHPGALNAAGCHRVRKTGGYHCHAGAVRRGAHRRFIGWGGGEYDFSSRHGKRQKRRVR